MRHARYTVSHCFCSRENGGGACNDAARETRKKYMNAELMASKIV